MPGLDKQDKYIRVLCQTLQTAMVRMSCTINHELFTVIPARATCVTFLFNLTVWPDITTIQYVIIIQVNRVLYRQTCRKCTNKIWDTIYCTRHAPRCRIIRPEKCLAWCLGSANLYNLSNEQRLPFCIIHLILKRHKNVFCSRDLLPTTSPRYKFTIAFMNSKQTCKYAKWWLT